LREGRRVLQGELVGEARRGISEHSIVRSTSAQSSIASRSVSYNGSISNTVSDISQSSATLSRSVEVTRRDHDKKEVVLNAAEPAWHILPMEEVLYFSMTIPESIDSVIEVMDLSLDKAIADFPENELVRVKIAPHAFAKGYMRAAYYAQQQDGKTAIVKESMYINKSYLTKARYEWTLQCHRVAKYLALQFNRVKPTGCPSVNFCNACIIQFMARPGQPYMVMEDRIPGEFEKFSNNSGYVAPSPTKLGTPHEAVQAFSHWTNCVTRNCLLVVDCQGGYDPKAESFMLTDPAIHCRDLSRFGETNIGTNGLNRFFATHQCNKYCTAMGLMVPKMEK